MRRFVWDSLAAAISIALLGLTASCAGHRDETTVRIGLPIDPSTLNQIFDTQTYEQDLSCMIFSGLTLTDDRGNVEPDLAESIPSRANGGISADGLTITYRLRPGLRWQDGKPLTAADVVFTLSAIRNPRSTSLFASSYDNVASAVASDSRTVVFRLKHRQSNALTTFFNNPGGAILPRHLLQGVGDLRHAAFNAHPIGSGPYVVESWTRGSDVRLRTNALYFRGKPPVERVRVEFLPSASTRAFEALTGNLDLATDLDPSSVATLRQASSLRIVDVPEATLIFLAARVDDAPLNDSRVRQALRATIDRSALARRAFLGFASPAMEFVPPWTRYATLRVALPSNLKEAAALLDSAGWRVGSHGIRERAGRPLDLTLTFGADAIARRTVALLLQSQWRRLGIDVALRGIHTEALLEPDGVLDRENFQLALYGWGPFSAGDPDRSYLISSPMIPPAGSNFARYRSSQVDAAVIRANESLDPAVRMNAYATIAKRVASDSPYIPLVWRHEILAVSNRLAGAQPDSAGSEFCRAYAWRLR